MLVLVVAMARPAGAHAQLEWTDPVQSSVLPTSPRQVVVHFGEAVEIDFGSLRVIGPRGNRVDDGGTHHPPGDSHSVAISLPPRLNEGTYVVAWRVISADSHPVHGAFLFSVGAASGAGRAGALAKSLSDQAGSLVVGSIFWAVRFAAFAGLVSLVGVALVVALVWPAGGPTRRIGHLLWGSWSVLFFCTLAGIAIQGVYAAALPLGDIVHPKLVDEVVHTRFGQIELLRVVLLLAFVPALLALRRRPGPVPRALRPWAVLGAIAGGGLLFTPGLAGHASSEGSALVGMTLDVAHLGSVSIWLGGLAVLAVLLVPGLPEARRLPDMQQVVSRISTFSFCAVLAIVTTGVLQSIRLVGSFYALFATVYGRILIVKVGLVVVLISVGALSRQIVRGRRPIPLFGRAVHSPREVAAVGLTTHSASPPSGASERAVQGEAALAVLDSAELHEVVGNGHWTGPALGRRGFRNLRRSVLAEIVIALAVLGVTASLVNAAPAKEAASQPFTKSFSTLGVQINAIVDPAKVGPGNQFHFYVLGRSGQPVALAELDASISLPGQRIGALSVPLLSYGHGHYSANHVTIPFAGNWVLDLVVRTTAIDEQEVVATLPVH